MAEPQSHRDVETWRQAMGLAEQVYRVAARLTGADAPGLGAQLLQAAALVPVHVARGFYHRKDASALHMAEDALLGVETYLWLAVRLGALPEGDLAGLLSRLDALRQRVRAPDLFVETPTGASSRASGEGTAPPPAAPVQRAPGGAPAPRPPASSQPRQQHPPDRVLVDGCNFLGRASGFELGDEASRDRLLFRLQEYARRHPSHRVVLFFDGQRASRRVVAGIEEHFTSANRVADDLILDYLRALSPAERRRSTLVTDDRDLLDRARKEGASIGSVSWLAEKLTRKSPLPGAPRQEPALNSGELSDWEQFFSKPPKRPGK
jgi:four helix bundle protein